MKRMTLLLTLTVASLALAAPVAMAQSNLGLKRIGASIGLVDAEALGTTVGLGVFADHGTVTPNINLESRIDYWSQSDTYVLIENSMRDIALSARGKYNFEVSNPKIRPFLGAGLSVHFFNFETTVPGFGSTSASTTDMGVDLGGGISTPLSPKTDLLGETWFGVIDGPNTFAVRAGLSFKLGS